MSLKEAMAELTTVAKQLNEASDELNEQIKDFEDELARAGVGLVVWLEKSFQDHQLGYVKIDNEWCVAVRASSNKLAMPLARAPRHVRVAAVDHFEELVRELTMRLRIMHAHVNSKVQP
jgi:hypothetical protein